MEQMFFGTVQNGKNPASKLSDKIYEIEKPKKTIIIKYRSWWENSWLVIAYFWKLNKIPDWLFNQER